MPSETLSLDQLEEQLVAAEAMMPGDVAEVTTRMRELRERIRAGAAKIEAARARRADQDKIQVAQQRLDELMTELAQLAAVEIRRYVLGHVTSMVRDMREMPCVPGNARLAIVVPDLVEIKVRLDGTDDVPF